MEHLFPAFVRVLRNLDDADGLLAIFQEFENNPSALSAEDRTRLLDFPDLATQVANIAATAPTTLNKQDFLRKAAESPRDLTSSEINLLKRRYWGKLTFDENEAFEDALDTLAGVSYKHRTETLERLQNFQSHLYEQYEAKAIANASDEEVRRVDEITEARKQEDLDIMLQKGQPWLRQLWQEDQGKKPWGYAIFENPQWKAENPDRWESYDRKSSHSRHMAFSAIASGVTIQARYSIEPLDWPSKAPTDDESFPVILSELRKQFNYLRSYPPKKGIADLLNELSWGTINSMPEGLTEGTLRNVFLYLDGNAAASVLDNRLADDFWIWAVDPDYVVDTENQSSSGYKGYLRVRLQQLINNFYVARRWHADEISMEDLWKAAQKDPHNGSFVSMEDEEIFSQDSTWEVATAVRPKHARLGASD
ncbi:hypothetical protein N7532_001435 [Penicillium argentinense]|uniref:Uncharacterized protein n=1 Tax=Penicillium argentinense TaxID=1131581 RepID=A0A9W9G3C4_9EURO|nr:uncharacterized protein N7532_001435 [Penicillium argentinense]KAJ5110900.1 hypothetical protein N7532_001435 [Penicillium argentinense]